MPSAAAKALFSIMLCACKLPLALTYFFDQNLLCIEDIFSEPITKTEYSYELVKNHNSGQSVIKIENCLRSERRAAKA